MPRIFTYLFGLILAFGTASGIAVPWNQPLPDIPLKRINGEHLELSDYQGKLIVINFWAPWCLPCRKEMPDLQVLHQRYNDTVVIGLTVDYASKQKVRQTLEEMEIRYPVILSDTETAAAFGDFRGLPTTFFVSPEGRIVERHMGMMSKKEMAAYRQKILRTGP